MPQSPAQVALVLYAQAGTEDQPLSLRPGMADLLRAEADGEADVLIVVDAEHLHCGRPELEGYAMVSTRLVLSAAGSNRAAGAG